MKLSLLLVILVGCSLKNPNRLLFPFLTPSALGLTIVVSTILSGVLFARFHVVDRLDLI